MNMKKISLLVALAGAYAAPAAMAQSTVQVYGKLYPYLEQEKGSGASAVGTPVSSLAAAATGVNAVGSVKGMSAGNSYLGFKGKEDLGDGFKATYQLEGVVAVDNGASAGYTFGRNTYVGLEGAFGDVRLGNMDTIFKEYGDTLGIMGISSGTPVSSSNILRKPGFGTSSAARFHERRVNAVRYETREFAGLQLGAMWATQENPTASIGPATTTSIGIKYDAGPFFASLAYEVHNNFFGGSSQAPSAQRNNGAADKVTSKDTAMQATFEWRLSKEHRFEFDIINKKYSEAAIVNGRFVGYKNTAYMVAYDGRITDQWRVMAHIVKSGAGSCERLNAVCNTTGLEGGQVTVGLSYNLSKRSFLYGAYNKVSNGVAARFSSADFGAPTPGEDITHLMFGISHTF